MQTLKVHILNQHPEHGMAECDTCKAMAKKDEEIKKLNRRRTVMPKSKPFKKKFLCHAGDCRKALATALKLEHHLLFDHDKKGQYFMHTCDVCHTEYPQ